MAKKISLQLEIGGVKQNVSSINDLEKAIKGAKEQLAGLDIGSQEFQKLSGEIRKAQNFAEDLNESLKPQELEKRVGAYAKVGSAIVSSFAAAQSAISLFGNESEDVARAAAKAQSILTIALTAREVAEGAVALKTVAANVATFASAQAANAATIATRALWTALASNPLTAIVAAIGLVVGALLTFNDTAEDTVTVNEELQKVSSETALALESQARILKSANVNEQTRLFVIKELNKEYPGFNAFIDKENKLTKEGEKFIALRIIQYEKEARIKFLLNKLLVAEQKQQEILTADIEQQVSVWEGLVGAVKEVFTLNPAYNAYIQQIEENTQALIDNAKEQNNINALIEKEKTDLANVSVELNKLDKLRERQVELEQRQADALKRTRDRQKELLDAYNKGKTTIPDLTQAINNLAKAYGNLDDVIKTLSQVKIDTQIVEDLKKISAARKALVEETISDVEKFSQEGKKLFSVPADVFYDQFVDFRVGLEQLIASPEKPLMKFDEFFSKFLEDTKKKGMEFNQEQIVALRSLLNVYREIEIILKQFGGDPKTNPIYRLLRDLPDLNVEWKKNRDQVKNAYGEYSRFFDFLGEQLAAEGLLTREIGDTTRKLEKLLTYPDFDAGKAKANVAEFLNFLSTGLIRPMTEKLAKAEIDILKVQLSAALTPTEQQTIKGQIDELTKELNDFVAGRRDKITLIPVQKVQEGINNFLNSLKKGNVGANEFEQQIFEVKTEVDGLTNSLNKNAAATSKAAGAFIKSNLQKLLPEIFGVEDKAQKKARERREAAKKDFEGLSLFYQQLLSKDATNEVAVQIETYDDLIDAYIDYQDTIDALKKKDQQSDLERIQEQAQNIGNYIQTFGQYLNQVASLSNQSIQNQLEFLRVSYENQLEQIVGDTQSANDQRLELQQEYEQRRKELEKKERISSLKFALAQAVANGAQAITGIWASLSATGPAGLVLAGIQTGIVAAITAAEIAIINEQINTASMMRKGGLIRAQGGMLLSGPSHERGGIPMAQMGVVAEGQEAIINRNSLVNFRDLLSTINQSGGGRPLVVNTFDDSRIVEAIAEQKQKPLRAYVLQSEITNEQALSKRLDDLSKI